MQITQWAPLGLFLAAALAASADEPKPADKAKTDPPGVPVLATLTSNKASYKRSAK